MMMLTDRGFDAMIPKHKRKEEEDYYFNHNIKFKVMNAEFDLSFKVKKLKR